MVPASRLPAVSRDVSSARLHAGTLGQSLAPRVPPEGAGGPGEEAAEGAAAAATLSMLLGRERTRACDATRSHRLLLRSSLVPER